MFQTPTPVPADGAIDVDSILRSVSPTSSFLEGDLGLGVLLINLSIGLVIALVLRWHFMRFGAVMANKRQFARIFPFVLLTTLLIITVVKSSLALSLGLVGALSIVRFRTPIKEPEELAYLFICISVGLGLGANQVAVAVVGTVFILLAVTLLGVRRGGRDPKALYLSITTASSPGESGQLVERINTLIAGHVESLDLRRLDSGNGRVDLSYQVDFPTSSEALAAVQKVEDGIPGASVTLIDQSSLMSM